MNIVGWTTRIAVAARQPARHSFYKGRDSSFLTVLSGVSVKNKLAGILFSLFYVAFFVKIKGRTKILSLSKEEFLTKMTSSRKPSLSETLRWGKI